MMIPFQEILSKYNLKPKGVIHVGAHWAEEHDDYLRCGIERFVYIEPCRDAFNILVKKFWRGDGIFYETNPKVGLLNVACGSEEGEMPMYVSHQNQGQSNSLLKPELHKTQHPEIIFDDAELVKVFPLDKLIVDKQNFDMLAMDVQGYEGEVLKGAAETLKHIDIIYTEVNRGQTYSGNMEIEEMDKSLAQYGFERVETYWPSPNWTWGDAVFIKRELYHE